MNLQFDFEKKLGKIKPMHAVGQPPTAISDDGIDGDMLKYLKEANIPYSRMHDVGEGFFGDNLFVDVPNLFRDFDADENDPASYDFAFTDELFKVMHEYGIEPYFRLGVTIENAHMIKAYRIFPPKDPHKWARICEHIVRHYNEGWADGFEFGITYWEIWNEPENREDPKTNQMWTGTKEQYYELFDVTAKHLKKCFGDKIKVGGYGACGFYGIFGNPEKYGLTCERRTEERYNSPKEDYRLCFFFGFWDYIKKNGTPIDFFAWHTYDRFDTINYEADFVARVIEEYGYAHVEIHLNEWNLSHSRKINCGTSYASANAMAVMLAMQHKKLDMLLYYDARYLSISAYGGFYDLATYAPSNVYYAFKAFGELYALGNEVECICPADGTFAVSATDGERRSVVITNIAESVEIETELTKDFAVYIIDENNLFVKTELDPNKFTLAENTVAVIKNF